MSGWTLCFVLLLPLTVCQGIRVNLVKTIQSKPDVTEICRNETVNIVTLIVCKISTEKSRGDECRLLYQHGRDFDHRCDSRFTLITKNQTFFLHLNNLKAEDSGNYTCECSLPGGTYILHINVTVEKDEVPHTLTAMTLLPALIGLTLIIIMTAILSCFYMKTSRRRQLETPRREPTQDPQNIEPYSTFKRKECGLYSTAKFAKKY
ncbi:uncharacterized protein [Channa argus]|uniref:uncharacterized protein n=1 Tax=Channa argus TaxID=215402 RepID=UPI003521E85C